MIFVSLARRMDIVSGERPRSVRDSSAGRQVILFVLTGQMSLDDRACMMRWVATSGDDARTKQYTDSTLTLVTSWASKWAPREPVAPVSIYNRINFKHGQDRTNTLTTHSLSAIVLQGLCVGKCEYFSIRSAIMAISSSV